MATDKRLDQVSTLTDFDYALIVKGDQVAKASKQQLAELVGNLLYGATNASSLATVVAEQMGSPIVFGQLPYISANSVGNPSSVKKTCFGFFNNTLGADTYCPKAGGVFIRFYNAESDPVNSTLYFVFKYVADLNGLYVIQDGGILMKIAEV